MEFSVLHEFNIDNDKNIEKLLQIKILEFLLFRDEVVSSTCVVRSNTSQILYLDCLFEF